MVTFLDRYDIRKLSAEVEAAAPEYFIAVYIDQDGDICVKGNCKSRSQMMGFMMEAVISLSNSGKVNG
jgi:hypothetical protein